ncbi:MAG TPA: tRNA guanosine(34) transglycosylase Tgt [Planctomycetota bacterium]|nr:tRNA guanosine(34) transglycosylase Tgt [Planctomycetota bacterium]
MSEAIASDFSFKLLVGSGNAARAGRASTAHGAFDTPCFMAVGTQAVAKSLSPDQLRASGVQVLLANAYHLALRPGAEAVAALGGLQEMTRWRGPMLTDSGGFQIWSLGRGAANGAREDGGRLASRPVSLAPAITEEGARFRSHLDGSEHLFTPEGVISLEERLGADMMMCLDECLEYPAGFDRARQSAERTVRWAQRCRAAWKGRNALFGIVQGGSHRQLRVWSAERLAEMDFPGYAVGGLSVGEGPQVYREVLEYTLPALPVDKPRYVMGVGEPEDVLTAVELGADMFDCVLPTRNGRRGQVFTRGGKLRLKNARFRTDRAVIEEGCDCPACAGGFSRGYVRHLLAAGEVLGGTLCSAHNLRFFTRLVGDARSAVLEGRFTGWKRSALEPYGSA